MKLVYLLEGNMPTWTSEYIYGVQNKALASSILMTSLRDDYHVVHALPRSPRLRLVVEDEVVRDRVHRVRGSRRAGPISRVL